MLASHDLPQSPASDLPLLARRIEDLLEETCPSHVVQNLKALPALSTTQPPQSINDVLASAIIRFQRWAGMPVVFCGLPNDEGENAANRLFFEYRLSNIATAAGQLASYVTECLLHVPDGKSLTPARNAIEKFVENNTYVLGTSHYIRIAEERRIPWSAVTHEARPLSLGQGIHRQRSSLSFTDATSHISTALSSNKYATGATLRAQGLPAPMQYLARNENEAVNAARRLRFPVVVKPLASDYGNGVSTNLTTDADVKRAYRIASAFGKVIVETFLPGDSHRITILNGKVLSVRRLSPAHIIGDGALSIRQLIEATNRERAQDRSDVRMKPIALNEETEFLLARQNLTPESVPTKGEKIILKSQANRAAGGTIELVTDITHPDNIRLGIRAAALFGIDLAGLDFMTTDISKSYLDIGGGFCELNVNPGLILGEEADIIESWFPRGASGRIPTIGVIGDDGALATQIAAKLASRHPDFTWASREGFFAAGHLATKGRHDNLVGAQRACSEPTSTAALIELDADDIYENGLGLDHIDRLVVAPGDASPHATWAQALLGALSGKTLINLSTSEILGEIDQFLSSVTLPA
ncbi:MAG: hypothetical protein GC184_03950 [Rhizobiales bacterium]|nr:hypothetical protein [Hyphomicrobiales bacterium]